MPTAKKVAIFYPYFLPAYKAGGPIQSIANICRHFGSEDFQFYIICGDTDYRVSSSLTGIAPNAWNSFENGKANIYYLSKSNQKRQKVFELLKEVSPDYIFVNGIFFPLFNIVPLFFKGPKKIISVRGMLHPGALSQKALKKKAFLSLLRFFNFHKKASFHATDENEKKFIQDVFGKGTRVYVAQNLPNVRTSESKIQKKVGEAKLISVALISPMKNHALILEALASVNGNIIYDIYGPIKDNEYWQECERLIKNLPQNIKVSYKGSVEPNDVHQKLEVYDCFIMPSKSENFGHAFYEALVSKKPVITSHFTPWNNLTENKAGWNVSIENTNDLSQAIQELVDMDNATYQVYADNTIKYAQQKVDVAAIKEQYKVLFS